MASMINCPHCGKLTDPQLESCPHCGGRVRSQARGPGARREVSRQTCPNCQAVVQEGDIICVACGTNLLTGQKIGEEVQTLPGRGKRMPWVVGGAIAAVFIVVLGFFGIWVASSDPLSQALRLVENGDYMRALEELRVYTVKVPDDERALYALARLKVWNGDPGGAAHHFERVAELNPSRTEAARAAVAYYEKGNTPDVRKRQVSLLEGLTRQEGKDPQLRYLLGLGRGSVGDVPGQVEALQALSASQLDTDRAVQWALGVGLALQGGYAKAGQRLDLALGFDPEEVAAAKGFLASMEGNTEEALRYLRRAVENPGLSVRREALTHLAKLLAEEGQFTEAAGYLDLAKVYQPADDRVYYLHALCQQAIGRSQNALKTFDDLSQGAGPYVAQAAVQAAGIYLSQGNITRARMAAERADSVGASTAPYYTIRGRIEAASANLSGARDYFNRAVRADSGYAAVYLENGLLYVRQESLSAGLEELERYLDLIGPDIEGTPVVQVRALAEQLRRTRELQRAPRRRAEAPGRRAAL